MSIDLVIERRLRLSPAACFSLLIAPNTVQQWWGPKDEAGAPFQSIVKSWNATPGGEWAVDMVAPDGRTFSQRGRVLEVDSPTLDLPVNRKLEFPIQYLDGRNDRYEEAPAITGHL